MDLRNLSPELRNTIGKHVHEPSPHEHVGQLSHSAFEITQADSWVRWFSGENAYKKRKIDNIEEKAVEHKHNEWLNKNTPVFGAFGGDRGISTMNESAVHRVSVLNHLTGPTGHNEIHVLPKRLTGLHPSNLTTHKVSSWW